LSLRGNSMGRAHPRTRSVGIVFAVVLAGLFGFAKARADYADGVFAQNHISLEAAVRVWRKAAWQNDDFLAQAKLGDIYDNAKDTRFYDPVEAYVWYYLASQNHGGQNWDSPTGGHVLSDRNAQALKAQDEILTSLSSEDRISAHDRIVYILSCQGAEGFLKLGRASADIGPQRVASVISLNNADALTYFHLADSMGSPLGRGYLNWLERNLRSSGHQTIVDRQATSFRYWVPPYEFYPDGDSASGVPLSDECLPHLERQGALVKAVQIQAASIQHALTFLGWRGANAISNYQASLLDDVTGKLTASQLVRAIQSAAVNGDAASQSALGVMYANGFGVVINYRKSEQWFKKAADQRYPAAFYYLAILYKAGPPGVDQDLHKSNDYMTNAALAGFKPSINQLRTLLDKAANAPTHPGQN
jgi:TPR repeat protein